MKRVLNERRNVTDMYFHARVVSLDLLSFSNLAANKNFYLVLRFIYVFRGGSYFSFTIMFGKASVVYR